MIITQEFHVDAAHYLPAMPKDHKCHRMHGHTYRVWVSVHGTVDATTGMVVDHDYIKTAWDQTCHAALDHRLLNEVEGLSNPTYEHIAEWIWGRLEISLPVSVYLCEIKVQEGMKSFCTYLGHGRKKPT